MELASILQILDSTVRLATPLLLACLAGLFSERAGVFDIGLEGKMLVAAFMSAAVSYETGDVWIGTLAGIGASLVFAAIHGLASITFRGNQLISGVAINFLASGLTVVLGSSWFGLGGMTPALKGGMRFADAPLLPLFEAAGIVPGPWLSLIFGHSVLVYVALLLVPGSAWLLYRTR
ncbi:MAG: ABC transporter permease, partial [Paracoccaceae bacterium]